MVQSVETLRHFSRSTLGVCRNKHNLRCLLLPYSASLLMHLQCPLYANYRGRVQYPEHRPLRCCSRGSSPVTTSLMHEEQESDPFYLQNYDIYDVSTVATHGGSRRDAMRNLDHQTCLHA